MGGWHLWLAWFGAHVFHNKKPKLIAGIKIKARDQPRQEKKFTKSVFLLYLVVFEVLWWWGLFYFLGGYSFF